MSELQQLHGAALYNPHLHGKEELVGLFAARQDLLDLLLGDLRASSGNRAPQHHLLIGQRGMGKTMLLHRLGFAVEDDPELSKVFLPLTFPEEQYNVARLSDFWLNCTDALSDLLDRTGRSQEAADLDQRAEALRSLDEDRRAKQALTLLIEASKKLGRRLVLLVDNIDLIFDRIGEQDWALREALSASPALVLIGASASAIESTYEYGKAFYDFFRVYELEGLDLDETRALIVHYAEKWSYPEVKRLAEEDPVRIRVLHNLTGGNPRTIALLFNVLALGVEGDVRTDLERLLDQCTPLYKARFEALSPQAQQIVHAVAVHWDPTSASELAEGLGMDVNAVSSQLARLVKQGVVEKVPYDPESKTGFQIAERFFNIWYLMRASRRVRRKLLWLVEFLKSFYSQAQLRARALAHIESMKDLDRDGRLRYAEYSFALAEAVTDQTWRHSLESSGLNALLRDDSLRDHLADLIDLDREPRLKRRAELEQRLEKTRPRVITLSVALPGWSGAEFWAKLENSLLLTLEQKVVIAENIARLNLDNLKFLKTQLDSEPEGLRYLYGCAGGIEALRKAVEAGLMTGAPDVEGAVQAESVLGVEELRSVAQAITLLDGYDERLFSTLESQLDRTRSPFLFLAWVRRGLEHQRISAERLRSASDQILALSSITEAAVLELSDILVQHDFHEEAVRILRAFLQRVPDGAAGWALLGLILGRNLMRYDEAQEALSHSLKLNPTNPSSWHNLGSALDSLGLSSEAETAYRQALDLAPNRADTCSMLGVLMFGASRLHEAEEMLRKAARLEPSPELKSLLGWVLIERRDLESASELAAEVAGIYPDARAILATKFASTQSWEEAAEQARMFLVGYQEKDFFPLLIFFREAVQAGRSREALQLLDETGASARWLPLQEALEAIARGSESYLRRVAPEVRRPAREIYRQLLDSPQWKTTSPSSASRSRRSTTHLAIREQKATRPSAGKTGGKIGRTGRQSRKRRSE